MFSQYDVPRYENFTTKNNSYLLLQNTVGVSSINKDELLEIINKPKHKLYLVEQSAQDTNSDTSINNDIINRNTSYVDTRNSTKFIENLRDHLYQISNIVDNNTGCEREIKERGSLLVDAPKEMFVQQFVWKKIVERVHLVINGLQFQITNELSEALRRVRRKGKRYEFVSLKGIYTEDSDTLREYNHKFSLIRQEARRAIANCREYKNINIDIILRQGNGKEETEFIHENLKRSQVKSLMPITLEEHNKEEIENKNVDNSEAKEHQKFNEVVTSDTRNPSSPPRDKMQEKIDTVENPRRINDTPACFNDMVALDILGPLPETNQGNKFILMVQDCFTRFIRIYALPDKDESLVVDTLLNTYFLIFGFPSRILTEQKSSFTYISFLDLRQNFGIEQVAGSSSHNEDNTLPEYRCAAFKEYLMSNKKERDWDDNLWTFSINYNATPNNCTGYSPIQLLYSKSTLSNDESTKNNSRIHKDCLIDLRERLATLQARGKENVISVE